MTGSLFDIGDEPAPPLAPAPSKPGVVRKAVRPLPAPLDESALKRPPLPHPLRDVVAGELERELAAWHRGEMTPDELMRLTRGATFVLESAELVRVIQFMVVVLREDAK